MNAIQFEPWKEQIKRKKKSHEEVVESKSPSPFPFGAITTTALPPLLTSTASISLLTLASTQYTLVPLLTFPFKETRDHRKE